MPMPLLLASIYLALNLLIEVWLARQEARRRTVPRSVSMVAWAVRYGPPLAGVAYLVTIADDWPFFLFVLAFLALGFWLLDGLLGYPERRPPRR